ncbi:DNA-binding MarR family transcriptional regulator [Actinomycetospora succinea]|uniref:DNA-binding MarR family transcriptional regulator n=1 Tax=Actinomycetospora succinea TaxID=663603 RepID=A0A4R6VGT1_9PSEU|nr:MarR family winged helix-turn-helix transcriptional regulator [Actinomycetospora succinea]TDQ60567.1 DNA-binding MarR family transcriptional regulator [Actinomycetospora succinea]
MTTPRVEADLGWALGRVARAHLRTAQDVVSGLPGGPRGYQVLAGLAEGPPRTQLALARTLGVDRTVMTYLLDELEGAGLVERRPDPSDRRARQVLLTEVGGARLCDLERRLRGAEDELLAPLDPAERDQLRSLLQRLAVGADGASACQVAADIQQMQGDGTC